MIDYPHFQHPALERFAAVAARFCDLVDSSAGRDCTPFLHDLHRILPALYLSGIQLPHTGVLYREDDAAAAEESSPTSETTDSSRGSDPDRQSHEEWAALATRLGGLIGAQDGYREVFDPYAPDSDEEVIGSLADDIADIYGDLVRGLRKWRRGETGEALWEWRFGLEHHWGEHLTGALRAIFALSAWHDLGWPDPTDETA